jgi:hypothetical protein
VERFLTKNPENSSHRFEKTRAVIATLRGDLAKAISWYEKYLLKLDDSKEATNIEKEIQRLETILNGGKEPLEIPA